MSASYAPWGHPVLRQALLRGGRRDLPQRLGWRAVRDQQAAAVPRHATRWRWQLPVPDLGRAAVHVFIRPRLHRLLAERDCTIEPDTATAAPQRWRRASMTRTGQPAQNVHRPEPCARCAREALTHRARIIRAQQTLRQRVRSLRGGMALCASEPRWRPAASGSCVRPSRGAPALCRQARRP